VASLNRSVGREIDSATVAHKVFDARSTLKEVTMSNIICVSVSHMIYPVTEAVLREVFEMHGYGVTMMALFQGSGWAKASVQLRSGHEAVHARDALHGRNIYDDCCNISIKCTPAAASSTTTTSSTAAIPVIVDKVMASPLCHEKAQQHCLLEVFDEVAEVHKEKDTLAQEELEDVLTHIGGSSLFVELVVDTADQGLDEMLLKDEPRSHVMLTQVAALQTECHVQHRNVPFFLVCFGTLAGGKLRHGSKCAMVCDAQKGGHCIPMRPRNSSAGSFYITTKKMLKLTTFFAKQWDTGASAPLAFLRYCCLLWEQLGCCKLCSICKATYTSILFRNSA
jgi:hypothetical protein